MMAPRALSGRRIVTTRDRRGTLDSALAAAGADVVHVPLITIEEPDDGGVELGRVLERLADVDWVIVTSQHGARRVGEACAAHTDVRLAAVGSRSAAVLSAASGRQVDVVPERQTASGLAAALVSAAAPGRVLVAQADRAEPTLAEVLIRSGFVVETVTAYRTSLRTPTARERSAALSADAVTFASGSAAEAWVDAIGPEAPPVVAAIGPVTAAAAERRGLKVTHVATDHHVEGLFTAVVTALTSPAIESERPRP